LREIHKFLFEDIYKYPIGISPSKTTNALWNIFSLE
jgi:fido (protein-threonine AMPylation protein)